MTKEQMKKIEKELSPEMRQLIVISMNTKEVEKVLNKKELEAVNKVKEKLEIEKPVKKIKLLEEEKQIDHSVELLKAGIAQRDLFYLYNLNMERDPSAVMDDVNKYAKEHGLYRPEFRAIANDILNNYKRDYQRTVIPEIAEEQDFVRENPSLYKTENEMTYDEEKYEEERREAEEEEEFEFFHNPFDLWANL